MAKKKEKKGYQGPKLDGDNSEYRKKQMKRAEKNAQGDATTNAVFASSDGEFADLCAKAGIKPTQRQASKFRNNYGKAAAVAGRSTRQVTQ